MTRFRRVDVGLITRRVDVGLITRLHVFSCVCFRRGDRPRQRCHHPPGSGRPAPRLRYFPTERIPARRPRVRHYRVERRCAYDVAAAETLPASLFVPRIANVPRKPLAMHVVRSARVPGETLAERATCSGRDSPCIFVRPSQTACDLTSLVCTCSPHPLPPFPHFSLANR